jgi:hypothetical protein
MLRFCNLWGGDRGVTLYFAVTEETRQSVFEEEAGQTLLEDGIIRLLTFDENREELVQWIP